MRHCGMSQSSTYLSVPAMAAQNSVARFLISSKIQLSVMEKIQLYIPYLELQGGGWQRHGGPSVNPADLWCWHLILARMPLAAPYPWIHLETQSGVMDFGGEVLLGALGYWLTCQQLRKTASKRWMNWSQLMINILAAESVEPLHPYFSYARLQINRHKGKYYYY